MEHYLREWTMNTLHIISTHALLFALEGHSIPSKMNNTRAKLIATLRLRSSQVVPYEQLVDSIWGHDPLGGPLDPLNVIKVCTCALRKLGAPIVTRAGVGLMWDGTVKWVQPRRVPGQNAQNYHINH